jgi:phosphate starvation-inducible protein PhoH and related proteins
MKRSQKVQSDRVQKEKFQRNQFTVLNAKNDKQKELLESFKYASIVVAQGSAGVGKTMLACYHAARKLHFGDIKKVVLIRAYQPLAGRSIGFLPGSLDEKLLPFYQQMIDYFEDFLGKATTEIHLKNKTIEICSLETIRGRSWNDCIIIVDESQSLYVPEIQALTTRIGENSQMIFCGDNTGNQTDVKNGMDGLTYLNKVVKKYSIPDVEFVSFTRDQICRSDIVREFVVAYEEELLAEEKGESTIVTKSEVDKQFRKVK